MDNKLKSKNFQIKFNSENVHPDNINLTDLTNLLSAFEQSLLSIVRDSAGPIFDTVLGLSLVKVKPGCAAYELQPISETSNKALRPAIQEYYRVARLKDRSNTPKLVRKSIEEIENFSLKYACKTELRTSASNKRPNVVIHPPRILKLVHDAPLSGETSIYGKIESVGGADTPTAWLRQADGTRIKVLINQKIARSFGERIYDWIGLRGHAKWDNDDTSIENFKLLEILEYKHTPVCEAFDLLSKEIGHLFEHIHDADDFVTDLRRE